jgi:hypothetical protein
VIVQLIRHLLIQFHPDPSTHPTPGILAARAASCLSQLCNSQYVSISGML